MKKKDIRGNYKLNIDMRKLKGSKPTRKKQGKQECWCCCGKADECCRGCHNDETQPAACLCTKVAKEKGCPTHDAETGETAAASCEDRVLVNKPMCEWLKMKKEEQTSSERAFDHCDAVGCVECLTEGIEEQPCSCPTYRICSAGESLVYKDCKCQPPREKRDLSNPYIQRDVYKQIEEEDQPHNWEEEFDNKFIYDSTDIVDLQKVKAFITKVREEAYNEGYNKGYKHNKDFFQIIKETDKKAKREEAQRVLEAVEMFLAYSNDWDNMKKEWQELRKKLQNHE